MKGHGITVVGATVAQAVVRAVNLNILLEVTVDLARLGVSPPDLSEADIADLPDLGSEFNDDMTWIALVADADG